MKRKIYALILALILLMLTLQPVAYAEEVSPRYSGVSAVISTMALEFDSILAYTVDVHPLTQGCLDRVHIDAELRTVGGRIEKTYDEDLPYELGVFSFEKRRAVTVEGVYFLRYTVKCYKDGKLIDTITKSTVTASYPA